MIQRTSGIKRITGILKVPGTPIISGRLRIPRIPWISEIFGILRTDWMTSPHLELLISAKNCAPKHLKVAKLCASSINLSDELWTQSYSSVPFIARNLKKGKTRFISILSNPIKVVIVVVVIVVVFVQKSQVQNIFQKKNHVQNIFDQKNFKSKKL